MKKFILSLALMILSENVFANNHPHHHHNHHSHHNYGPNYVFPPNYYSRPNWAWNRIYYDNGRYWRWYDQRWMTVDISSWDTGRIYYYDGHYWKWNNSAWTMVNNPAADRPAPEKVDIYVGSAMITTQEDLKNFICTTIKLTASSSDPLLSQIHDDFNEYRVTQVKVYNRSIFENCGKQSLPPKDALEMVSYFDQQSKRFRPGSYRQAQKLLQDSLKSLKNDGL